MKKYLFIVVILIVLFLFRDELKQYWISHFPAETSSPIAWFHRERDSLYNSLPGMSFAMYIESLKDFEDKVIGELNQLAGDNSASNHKRNLICELAVIHKKMAMRYLQNGNTELYAEHIRLSQNKLAECANLGESP